MATIPSRKATFTEEEKRMLVEGTNAQGKPLSEAEKMKLSKMHTARTIGADWRERGAERMKAEEPARAQQALAERVAINRSLAPRDYKLPTRADEFQDIPGGGKVKIGAETLKRMQGFEKQRSEAKAAEDIRKQNLIYDAGVRANTALQKRYEDELAARGFAPPKTRQEQEAIDRARMDEFRLVSEAKSAARERDRNALDDYKRYNSLAKAAELSGDRSKAEELSMLAEKTGGQFRNQSERFRFIENQEMARARAMINEKTKARIAKTKAQNTSTPEATVSGYRDFVTGVNQEPLSPLPPPLYQVFAGKYGEGTSGRYVRAEGPTVRSSKQKSKAKSEAEVVEKTTPLSASIKQFEKQEAAAGVESNNKKIQEAKREIAELSKTTTKPIGSELPERKKTLRELKRDENKILELQKKIESLSKKS